MEKKKKLISDKTRLVFMGILIVFVTLSLIVYGFSSYNEENLIESASIFAVGIVLLIIAFLLIFKNYNEVSKGFPLFDERSKKVMNIASSKAFYLSIWWILILGILSESVIEFRDISQATNLGVGGMALIFALCWLFVDKFVKNLDECY